MADPFRYENLTPDQIKQARGLYESYGMQALPLERGAADFNALPLAKREQLFNVLSQSSAQPPAAGKDDKALEAWQKEYLSDLSPTSDVTVTAIGGRPIGQAEPLTVEDLRKQGINARPVTDFSKLGVPEQVLTVEDLLARGINAKAVYPSVEETKQAASAASERGLVEGLLGAATVGGGIRAGIALMPFTGPAAPYMPAIGALAGFTANIFALGELEEGFEEKRPKNPELQPLYEGIRTMIGGISSGPLIAYSLPTATAQAGRFAQLVGQLGDFARANKKLYFARDAIVSAYAGLYKGIATEALPPSEYPVAGPVAGLIAETAAGILSPGKIAVDAFMASRSTAEGINLNTEREVAKVLSKIVAMEGGDPKLIADELAAALANRPIDPKTGLPLKLTSSQLINSRPLTALERTLARNNAKLSSETEETGKRGVEVYTELLRQFKNSGDPLLIKKAVQMEEARFAADLQMAIDQATFLAAEEAAKLGLSGVKDRARIAAILDDKIQEVLAASKATASELFTTSIANSFRLNKAGTKMVPIKVKANNFTQQFLELVSGLDRPSKSTLRTEFGWLNNEIRSLGLDIKEARKVYRKGTKAPEYVEEFFRTGRQGVSPALEGVDVPEMPVASLNTLKSELQRQARKLAAQPGKEAIARQYDLLASSILDDLSTLDDPVYSEARSFYKAYKDVFGRTFAGKLDDVDSTGRLRIPLETLVRRTLMGGADVAYLKMREITDAARFSEKLVGDRQAKSAVTAAYNSEAEALKNSLAAVKLPNINDPRQVTQLAFTAEERARGARAISLAQFVKQTGGIADVGGELAGQDITNKVLPGLVRKVQRVGSRVIVPPEASIDAVRERVFEAGYFSGKTDYNQITDTEIIDALRRDLFQSKVWTLRVQDKLAPVIAQNEMLDDWASQGITPDMDVRDIASRLFRLDEDARKQGLPPLVSNSKLDEFARQGRPVTDINPTEIVNTVLGAQREFVRSFASEATRLVNVRGVGQKRLIDREAFNKYVEANKDLIDELGLTEEFSNISNAQLALDDLLDPKSPVNKTLRNQKIFQDLLDYDSPYDAILPVVTGKTPVTSTKDLLKVIADSAFTPDEKIAAKAGLKDAFLTYAYNRAGGDTSFNANAYIDALYKPLDDAGGQFPSLMRIMRQEGLVTPQEFIDHKRLYEAIGTIQKSMGSKILLEEGGIPTGMMNTLEEIAISQLAARVAGMISPGGPGSLTFAQKVIKRGEMIFKRMPAQKQKQMLEEAAKNPELLEQLLRRDLTAQQQRALGYRLLSLVFSPSVLPTAAQRYLSTPSEEEVIEEQRQEAQRKEGKASARQEFQTLKDVYDARQRTRPAPPAPTTRGLPNQPKPGAGAPPTGGGTPPTTGSPTQSRQMLQQLFPYDAIVGAAALSQNPAMQQPMQPPVA